MSSKKPEDNDSRTYWRLKEWFPDIPAKTHRLFDIYVLELRKFNDTVNLISPRTMGYADQVHFSDSILASQLIAKDLSSDHIFDIGSGNGFPGVVFSILNPSIKVTFLDSDSRKMEFIKHIGSTLKLTNVDYHIGRVEELPEQSINNAMCRGFASLSSTLIKTRKNFAKNGRFYHLKSDTWAKELAEVPSQVCTYWKTEFLGQYDLPHSSITYAVLKTDRI